MNEYLITNNMGEATVVEKKSRFIAKAIPIESEEEAILKIEELKKQYWDARHNCYAYVLGKNNEKQKFSDDGEPSGTAGKPILDVLLSRNIHNTLVLVTRYFGGTLLGTGGLIRAYSKATVDSLDQAELLSVCDGIRFDLKVDYSFIGKIKYIMVQFSVGDVIEEYSNSVILHVAMKKENFQKFKEQVVEATSASAIFENVEEVEYREKVD